MPRNLRSSAPNTPNKARAVDGPMASPTLTRKPPHCKQCKRPRAGHPRSGCPFVNIDPTQQVVPEPDDLAEALSSLHITPPLESRIESEQESRPRANPDRPSRHSLSTSAGEIFERLRRQDESQEPYGAEPYGTERRHSRVMRIVEWCSAVAEAMVTESDTSGHSLSRQPTLLVESLTSTEKVMRGTRSVPHSVPSSNSVVIATRASSTRPLVRSMSMEEREAFIKSLNQASDATVYVVPKADIFDVQASASRIGFRTRIVMNEESEDLQALLVLAREDDAVEWLFGKIEKEDREATMARKREQHSGRSISFSALAGGAVIGAVGAWAGLAFT